MSTEPVRDMKLEKYLNKCDLTLTGYIHQFRRDAVEFTDQRQYLEMVAWALNTFQSSTDLEKRALLHVTKTTGGLVSLRSTYRFTDAEVSEPFATLEFDPRPTTMVRTFSDMGRPHALSDALIDRSHLSLTYLLRPVRNLVRGLRGKGWKVYADAIAGDKIITGLTDGSVALYVIVDLAQLEADTAAIKEFHANKETPDERSD
ncbi:hypothetical protein D3C85_149200 [compost metagenome]